MLLMTTRIGKTSRGSDAVCVAHHTPSVALTELATENTFMWRHLPWRKRPLPASRLQVSDVRYGQAAAGQRPPWGNKNISHDTLPAAGDSPFRSVWRKSAGRHQSNPLAKTRSIVTASTVNSTAL
jgi:hypothetical protein